MSRVPLVLQATLTDCAPACLAMILGAHRRGWSMAELRDELGAGRDGVTALAIRDVAMAHGLNSRAARVAVAALSELPVPFIALWQDNHFVVVEQIGPGWIRLIDPALGRRRMNADQFGAGYTGVVQVFEPADPDAAPVPPPAPGWTALLPGLRGQSRSLLLLAAVTFALLAAGLTAPLATGLVVAQLSSGGYLPSRLVQVALAIALLASAVGGLGLLRGVAATRVGVRIGRDLTGSLVHRLLAAPLLFLEHRGRGDVVSRVTATETVRDAVATRLVATALDGLVGTGYLIVLIVLDPFVGGITASAAAVQLLLLSLVTSRLRQVRREELLAEAYLHGWLLESIAGMAWLKAAGAERQAYAKFDVLHEERLRGLRRSGRLSAVAEAVATAFRIAGPLVVLVAAAASVSAGLPDALVGASLGRVIALATLGAAALLPFSSVAANLHALHEISSVLHHLGDLVEAPAEQPRPMPERVVRAGRLTAAGLRFRHHVRAPWVVDGVDIAAEPGQKIAIVGPSGSGKSTLARLLVGLYAPEHGSVSIDGQDFTGADLASLRRQMGIVLQEPFLVTGTLRDNISLRHPAADPAAIVEAAVAAGIHHEIMQMPNGYQTLVTESGVGLSGGQRQRLALARALLGRPKLLVLDEATSHVDQQTEALINSNLRALGVTQIVVAHRLSTVRDADEIMVMDSGRVVERGTDSELRAAEGRYADLIGPAQSPRALITSG